MVNPFAAWFACGEDEGLESTGKGEALSGDEENDVREIAAWERAGASNRDAKEGRDATGGRIFTTIGAFQKKVLRLLLLCC